MLQANKLGALGVLVGDALTAALDDLSPSAAALLLTLYYRPGITSGELARIAGVAQPTVVRLLDGLQRRGWVERRPARGRVTPLALTRAGRRRAEAARDARLAAMDRLLAPLGEPERRQFEALLDAVLAGATASREFARTTCRLCDHPNCLAPDCPLGRRASELEQMP